MGGLTHSLSPTLHSPPTHLSHSPVSKLAAVPTEDLGMSLECQGRSSAPAPLGEVPWVIPALLERVVSVLVRSVGDISKQCLLALYSSLPKVLGWRLPSGPGGQGVKKVRPGVSSRGSAASL